MSPCNFQRFDRISHICNAIDGTHIKLAKKPNVTLVPRHYWNRRDYNVSIQGIFDFNFFGNVVVFAPGGTHDSCNTKSYNN